MIRYEYSVIRYYPNHSGECLVVGIILFPPETELENYLLTRIIYDYQLLAIGAQLSSKETVNLLLQTLSMDKKYIKRSQGDHRSMLRFSSLKPILANTQKEAEVSLTSIFFSRVPEKP
ncbi:MAG: hypothetical protein KDH96_12350 [Candidatus Riesia sp.]|nr:hypothetical protein [Candidatus Riesia sp.]